MSKCKAKTIQTNLGTFMRNQAYPGIIQAYSGILKTLCNTILTLYLLLIYVCRTLAYSQPCFIQSPSIFRTLAYSKSKAYSELCQTPTMKHFAKIVNGYNYFCKLKLLTQCRLVVFSTS